MKTCSKCKISKALTEFSRHKAYKDGRACWCKSCQKEYVAKRYANNPRKVCKRTKDRMIYCINSWRTYFPKETPCQCCGKLLVFAGGDNKTSIHFDHRHEKTEAIKGYPTAWLKSNQRTPENEKIWESCDFGILCFKCNIMLPTYNRNEYITKLMMYVNLPKRIGE